MLFKEIFLDYLKKNQIRTNLILL